MAAQERLSPEMISQHTLIVCEHEHRYHLAASVCRDQRVLDLACGIGYGTEILANVAASTHGIDIDPATVELASSTVGERTDATFTVGDAADILSQDLSRSYDVIVCFEGLEHISDLNRALDGLCRLATLGVRLCLSIPNSRAFGEENEFHVTAFGYIQMLELMHKFSNAVVLYQYLAEGSVIRGDGLGECEAVLEHLERAEPQYANHFLILVNVQPDVITAYQSRMQLSCAPTYNRYMRNLERAYGVLNNKNNELGRKMLRNARAGDAHTGSGAAGVVAGLERQIATLQAEVVDQDSTIFALRREIRELRHGSRQ